MNLRKILRWFFRPRAPKPDFRDLITGHSRPVSERDTFAGAVPESISPEVDPHCGPFVSDPEGAAFVAGEQAALRVLVPLEDRGHERAFWLGFLSALRRRGSVTEALRSGAALVGEGR